MAAVSPKLLLFNCCFLFLFASTRQGHMPSPNKIWRMRPYVDQKQLPPLQVSANEQRLSRYENTRVRKSRELDDRYNERIHLRNYRYRPRLPESEFDADGMIFLSSPRNREDRRLNRLINKVIVYNMNEKNGYLRENANVEFTKDEIDRLKLIVRSYDDEAENDYLVEKKKTKRAKPEIYMNFADLVI